MYPSITQWILGFISLFVVIHLVSLFGSKPKDFRSVIVVTGIFGTFLGIFLGLQEFNTTDIAGSVPKLLEGMKIAFLTSVVGLGASVVLTVISILVGQEGTKEEAALECISQGIADLIDETKTGFKVTNYNLEHALEELSRGATEEIIDALNDVITEFNKNLKEQFGENFKQLNEAVIQMITWQDNYSSHVEETETLLVSASEMLDSSTEANKTSTTAAQAMTESMSDLVDMATGIKQDSERTANALDAQKKLITDLETLFQSLDSQLTSTSEKTAGLVKAIGESLSEQSNTVSSLTSELAKKLPDSLGRLERTLTGLTQKFAEDYQAFLDAVTKLTKSAALS